MVFLAKINRNMRCIEMAEDDFKVESANND